MSALLHTAQQFADVISEITPLGNGLINDTYRVVAKTGCFVLQRINHQVFAYPEQIMANLQILNQHVQQKTSADIQLQIPAILTTHTGKVLYQDEQQAYWRALTFIADSESVEAIRTLADAEQIGFALGHFHYLLSDLSAELLYDTLPDFHIAPAYLHHYQRIAQQSMLRPDAYCRDFITQFQGFVDDLETAKHQGLLALRVTHGDPKINNFLFDTQSSRIISLIDLDTVKPGLVHYDIGDCLRSCCHDTDNDSFNLDIAAAILKNYLAQAGQFFSDYDYYFLYPAIRLIPFELGLRFYSDYLDGNRYFKVTDSQQNLQRAIAQFRLCTSIMAQEAAIQSLIKQAKT
ncbi:phosphotransferase enzyme family protein [Crenothrix polyspora]|uniref:Aminoglycoside phosphotransferase n=1 Tax=Crenothrix polyspora TaxID=360316 RepID=A0A1R4HJ24_9GAMM|nr:aminoglycoside phosphotransferase family protein [Crenothrix polyspora]SJM96226.1 Aminoglycoside phosphotransferase [Crenothrix polyspora]